MTDSRMRSLASVVLSAVAFTQLLLLGGAAAFITLRLRSVEAEIARLGREEQAFLARLAAVEVDLFRFSILIRDRLDAGPRDAAEAGRELTDAIRRVSTAPLDAPPGAPPELRQKLDLIEAARKEYLDRARTLAAWTPEERRLYGRAYLFKELSPTRRRFSAAIAGIADAVRIVRQDRNIDTAASVSEIRRLALRVFSGAAVLGLALAGAAIWKFRHDEREREQHLQRLIEAEEGLRALSQRLLEAQEQERKSLSRELHDEVGQVLTALRVQLGQVAPESEASRTHLDQATELADRSLQSIRQMARGLRPAMLDDLGLGPALTWLARDVSRNTPLEVDLELEGEFTGLEEARRTCIYRVVQEALTNCLKHARATRVRVVAHESPDELVLTVQDNGVGAGPGEQRGVGLLGMRERLEELGGEFSVVSAPGAGLLLRARLPKGEA